MNDRALCLLLLLLSGCSGGAAVATVDGEAITRAELDRQVRVFLTVRPQMRDDEATRRQVLDQLVKQRLLVGQARKEGLDRAPGQAEAILKKRAQLRQELEQTISQAQAQLESLDQAVETRALIDAFSQARRKDLVVSDRRYAQAVGVLRAHAYLNGRAAVGEEDVPFLEHVLWRDPAERAQVRATIRELLQGYEDEVRVLLYQSRELRDYALRSWETTALQGRAAVEAHTKIRNILDKVDAILLQARDGGRPLQGVEALREEIAHIEREMLTRL